METARNYASRSALHETNRNNHLLFPVVLRFHRLLGRVPSIKRSLNEIWKFTQLFSLRCRIVTSAFPIGKSSRNFYPKLWVTRSSCDKLACQASRIQLYIAWSKPLATSCGICVESAILAFCHRATTSHFGITIWQFSDYPISLRSVHTSPTALRRTFSNRKFGPYRISLTMLPYSRQEHSGAQGDVKKSKKVSNVSRLKFSHSKFTTLL